MKLYVKSCLSAAVLAAIFFMSACSSTKQSASGSKIYDKYIDMAYVTGGSFNMGNDDVTGASYPVHKVTVSSFIMGKTPVTQELYRSVMGKKAPDPVDAQKPVDNVSWYDAVAFCNELSMKAGLTPCYSGEGLDTVCDFSANGYRLPTEAEWEYAARGGANHDPYLYSGSDTIEDVAWFEKNSKHYAHPVAQKLPNSLGIYDMSGNVNEWCYDFYDLYESGELENPVGGAKTDARSIRGGCYDVFSYQCKVTTRGSVNPTIYGMNLGFRVVRNAPLR